MNENNGGPAFPVENDLKARHYGSLGMTLRDYFAAKAMQGFVSDQDWRIDMDPYETARAAYVQADAMLKAMDA